MEQTKIANFLTRTKEYLRNFLRSRGVPSDGRESQKELAERCFWAEKLGLERRYTDDEAAEEIASTKCNKLILDGGLIKLPRPETLAEWESSLSSLPDLTRSRMETYITSVGRKLGCKGSKTLGLGKGLYLSNHVTDVEFHGISPNLNYCFVRAKVIPQTKCSKAPYHPWIVLNKLNGSVITAECSCIVGLQSGCKHIASVLFALVETVEKGLNRASTSKKVAWGQPSKGNYSRAVPAEDLHILKVKNNAENQNLRSSSKIYRSGIDSRAVVNRNSKSINSCNIDKLADITNGNCGILLYVDRPSDQLRQVPCIDNVTIHKEISTTVLPLTVPEAVASSNSHSPDFNEQIFDKLQIDENQKNQIIHDTVQQSSSRLWHNHRVGRITSSTAKLCSDTVVGIPPTHLSTKSHTALASVMNYYGNPTSPSLEWGKNMEKVAIKHYIANHKLLKKHILVCESTGLWLSASHPYIAASPDGIINCQQCGKGLLEVKNPYKYRKMMISELYSQKDSCLIFSNGVIQLDHSHNYYIQIQIQLWVTGFDWCDFVVRTISNTDNLHVERIYKDHVLVNQMLPKLAFFFFQGVVPEIQNRKVYDQVIENAVRKTVDNMLTILDNSSKKDYTAFPCSKCGQECSQNPESFAYQSIACDNCQRWSHFACIGLSGKENFLKKRKASWECSTCRLSKRHRLL